MSSTPHSAPKNLLEQAHLASRRGQYRKARRMLEALLDAEPNNGGAQELLAQIAFKEGSMIAGQAPKSSWWRGSLSSGPAGSLIVGLLFLGIGILQMVPIFQAGSAQGFGLQTVITVEGKTGRSYQVTMGSQAAFCCIPIGLGLVLLYLFFRQVSNRKT